MEKIKIENTMVQNLIRLSKPNFWSDYDEDTDTLYISFRKPQKANDSVMEDDLIYHYDNEDVVGVTVLNASKK